MTFDDHTPATVADLIKLLQTYPPDMLVTYQCYSEHTLLDLREVSTVKGQPPRPDGWVHDVRPDKEQQTYLLLPGN